MDKKINAALTALYQFKIAYNNKDGIMTIGDIDDLMANMDTIEECVRKQKRIPTTTEREFGLFGKSKIVHYCKICGDNVYSTNIYCPQCGQKFCM